MTDNKRRLAEYMRRALAAPFAYGKTDCCTTANRWIESECGVSPLLASGYDFENKPQAETAMAANGGLAKATVSAMRKAGLKRTKSPQAGDVGVVEMLGRVCVAISDGNVWFARDECGVIADARARVIAAWRISKD